MSYIYSSTKATRKSEMDKNEIDTETFRDLRGSCPFNPSLYRKSINKRWEYTHRHGLQIQPDRRFGTIIRLLNTFFFFFCDN